MRSIGKEFYKSKAWKECRIAYLARQPLCERCLQRGEIVPAQIVHHKIYLNQVNVENPEIALNFDNLEAVCLDCHNKEHFAEKIERRWKFDEKGRLQF